MAWRGWGDTETEWPVMAAVASLRAWVPSTGSMLTSPACAATTLCEENQGITFLLPVLGVHGTLSTLYPKPLPPREHRRAARPLSLYRFTLLAGSASWAHPTEAPGKCFVFSPVHADLSLCSAGPEPVAACLVLNI